MNVRDDGGTILSVNIRRRQVLALLGQESAGAEAATPEQLLACASERWTPALLPTGASPGIC